MGTILRALITVCFLFVLLPAFPQEDSLLHLKLIKKINGVFSGFDVDNQDNLYLVNSLEQIIKLNGNFDSVGIYNDEKHYGGLTSIDVTNPSKILACYNDFRAVVVLGSHLETKTALDLSRQGILQAKVIVPGYDNNYWLYDEWDRKIKKININGKILLESADFSTLFKQSYSPSFLADHKGSLYLYDISNGWLVFDYYGALKSKYELRGWTDPQVVGQYLTGRDQSYFYLYNPERLTSIRVKLNISLNSIIRIINRLNQWYILRDNCLEIYQAY